MILILVGSPSSYNLLLHYSARHLLLDFPYFNGKTETFHRKRLSFSPRINFFLFFRNWWVVRPRNSTARRNRRCGDVTREGPRNSPRVFVVVLHSNYVFLRDLCSEYISFDVCPKWAVFFFSRKNKKLVFFYLFFVLKWNEN